MSEIKPDKETSSGANKKEPTTNDTKQTNLRNFQVGTKGGSSFINNTIKTSKYSLLNFFPRNLFTQLITKKANLYYLFVMFCQTVDRISISFGEPLVLMPLVFVVGLSMCKDGWEDYKRYKNDSKENNCTTLVYNYKQKQFEKRKWGSVRVGQIVKINKDEFLPADIILVQVGEAGKFNTCCYVETKSLDGETNLKIKLPVKELQNKLFKFDDQSQIANAQLNVQCQSPDEHLYRYQGTARFNDTNVPMNIDNLLLRGTRLKNTDSVIGLVTYTGHDTKIMNNSQATNYKVSRIQRSANYQILIIFAAQILLGMVGAAIGSQWMVDNYTSWYMYFDQGDVWTTNYVYVFIQQTGTWFLIFSNLVPISLFVTLEFSRFYQGVFMSKDILMYDIKQDLPCKAQSSNLNEELGKVEYIFSDKTGTLTCNQMQFKKFSAGEHSYGLSQPACDQIEQQIQNEKQHHDSVENVDFYDPSLWDQIEKTKGNEFENIKRVLLHLSLCHTIVIDESNKSFSAQSPDELSLINAAKYFGCVYLSKDSNDLIKVNCLGEEQEYKLMNVCDFSSDRKRMSVVVKDMQTNEILLFCKGADSIIEKLLDKGQENMLKNTKKHCQQYALEGLRTLFLAQKKLDELTYQEWNKKQQAALVSINNREEALEEANALIEIDMQLIGSTAIEDKLQDQVPETIQFLKQAGIKVWVCTGDKVETAVNIGFSAGLLDDSLKMYMFNLELDIPTVQQLIDVENSLKNNSEKFAIVLPGDFLAQICNNIDLKARFVDIALQATAVMACRVSPKQKAQIVELIKDKFPRKTTLAIGDGMNDLSMINQAHVGVGIAGKEGMQAAKSSDFAIGQFKFLKPLMFIHGREAYRRNALLINYSFYKNVIFVFCQYYFNYYSVFSGQTLYDPWIYQLYNVSFTASPVMFYCLFDFEFTKKEFLSNPMHFSIGIENKQFSTLKFWSWQAYASWHALVILILVFICSEQSYFEDGKQYSFWPGGHNVYLSCVLIVNFVLIKYTNNFVGWMEFFIILSIAQFYIDIYWLCKATTWGDVLYGQWGEFIGQRVTHLGNLLATTMPFTIDKICCIIYDHIFKNKQKNASKVTNQMEIEINHARFSSMTARGLVNKSQGNGQNNVQANEMY